MNIWLLLSIAVIVVSFLFVLICADPYGSGFLSRSRRFFFEKVPSFSTQLLHSYLGESGTSKLYYYLTYLFTKPNPFFQVLYVVLSTGGYLIFVFEGFKYIPNPYLSSVHMYVGSFLYMVAFWTFIMACSRSPGVIHKGNLDFYLKLFKFDGLLYKPRDCPTCKFVKPARSKHCAVCNRCIAKQDHHCIWLNQCVGYGNYKYFLSFILSHSVICTYAGVAGFFIFLHIINRMNLLNTRFYDSAGVLHDSSYYIVFQFLIQHYPGLVFAVTLCLVMGLVLGGFFVYHLLMVQANYSSNERMKILDLTVENIIGEDYKHPYDNGFKQNLREVVFASPKK